MKMTISKLTSADLNAVDELMKRNSKTLGFLTKKALLEGFLNKSGVIFFMQLIHTISV